MSTDSSGRVDTGLRTATGRGRDEWYALLDEWGAVGRPYREIADWLVEHGMSAWWAQKTIVEYEQERGVRGAGARPDGTFSAGASKSVGAPLDAIVTAFADPATRERWLPGYELTARTSSPGTRLRFHVADGTRLSVTLAGKSDGRCDVAVEQERIADAERAASIRAAWVERLKDLKVLLET